MSPRAPWLAASVIWVTAACLILLGFIPAGGKAAGTSIAAALLLQSASKFQRGFPKSAVIGLVSAVVLLLLSWVSGFGRTVASGLRPVWLMASVPAILTVALGGFFIYVARRESVLFALLGVGFVAGGLYLLRQAFGLYPY